jgi:hypothetical protein
MVCTSSLPPWLIVEISDCSGFPAKDTGRIRIFRTTKEIMIAKITDGMTSLGGSSTVVIAGPFSSASFSSRFFFKCPGGMPIPENELRMKTNHPCLIKCSDSKLQLQNVENKAQIIGSHLPSPWD